MNMEYVSLFKKFVMTNPSECKKFYEERFNSESSYHFNFSIGKNEAFLFYHPSLFLKVSKIYQLDKEVDESFKLLPPIAQQHYFKKCLIDEVLFTNDIEGILSTRKEITEIISSIEKNKPKKEHRIEGIINSYLKLLEDDSIELNTSSDIRKIYDSLLHKEIELENKNNLPDGIIFRKGQVEVDNRSGESIHNGVYPEKEIITYMDNALSVLKDKNIDPLISVCIFHYLFGYIHPFYDGNGRTSRFITSYLIKQILAPITAFSISVTIKEKLSDYYKSFKETNDPRNYGDIGTFVNCMLDIIIESENKTILYAKEKNNTIQSIMEIIKSEKASKKEIDFLYVLVQSSLFSDDGLSMSALVNILNFDSKTIRGYIKSNSEIINIKKHGNEYLYSVNIKEIQKPGK